MRPPKFARTLKKKRAKKNHITKKEYRRTSAGSVDASLNLMFKERTR